MDRRTDGWADTEGWTDGGTDVRWPDGRTDRWADTEGWTDGRTDGQTQRAGQMEGQMSDGQTEWIVETLRI